MDAATGGEVVVAWQGGEPTMMGLDFFRRSIDLEREYARPGQRVLNTIQTNGTLLTDEWGEFLKENDFLVGVSIDGPREMHDAYRVDKGGKPTFDRVVRGRIDDSDKGRVVLAEDGVVVDLVDGLARIAGKVDCGYVFVDGSSVGDITESDLKDRRILGEEGFISVIVVVDAVTGKVSSGPEIHARGFAEDDSTFDAIKQPIIDALDLALAEGNTDAYQLQQTVRRVVGRWVSNTHRRRPMIIPVVIEA